MDWKRSQGRRKRSPGSSKGRFRSSNRNRRQRRGSRCGAPSRFAIFDIFPDEAGRDAHLAGRVAAALMEQAPELLAAAPMIEKLDVLATKLPAESGKRGREELPTAAHTIHRSRDS